MADFNTHIFWAAATSSLGATVCVKILALPVDEALLLTSAGVLGGILPDIDLKHSVPGKALFSALGVMFALAWLFSHVSEYSVVELLFFATVVYFVIRLPIWWLFHQFTVHRGTLHSLLAALMFSMATAAAGFNLLGLTPLLSWLMACFVAAGYVLHLLLDEIYSVDFMGVRVKRSFGTAFKILDISHPSPGFLAMLITAVLWIWTPGVEQLVARFAAITIDWRTSIVPRYILQLF